MLSGALKGAEYTFVGQNIYVEFWSDNYNNDYKGFKADFSIQLNPNICTYAWCNHLIKLLNYYIKYTILNGLDHFIDLSK